MNPLPFILAPVLLLPAVSLRSPSPDAAPSDVSSSGAALVDSVKADQSPTREIAPTWLEQVRNRQVARQVSIEQHITIRISPRPPAANDPRVSMFGDAAGRSEAPRFEERSMGKCVPIAGLAGMTIAPENRLVFFLRDSRVVRASLDKGCNARDFYSGFYVARNSDGMLCAGRDKLQARNGANCKLGKMKQIVEAGD